MQVCKQYMKLKNIPKAIPVVFRNGSNYNYHFIIKDLAKEFEGNLIVLDKILKNT